MFGTVRELIAQLEGYADRDTVLLAPIWHVEDIQSIIDCHPAFAKAVMQELATAHDSACGVTVESIQDVADELGYH